MTNHSEKRRARVRTSNTDENCVIVDSSIREDRRAKVRETQCKKPVVLYFTTIGKEHNHEGIFKLVKRWDK
jgi:hypothetical protein